MTSRRQFLGGLASLASVPICGAAFASTKPLSVVATTGMIADTAARIAGEHGTVRALMGPGVDPHSYRQTRTDILALRRADLILRNGLYLEAQLEDVLEELGTKVPLTTVGDAVPAAELVAHDTYTDRFDPHVWMDPRLWRFTVPAIRDALTRIAPERAGDFERNADEVLGDLDRLGAYATEVLATVPSDSRVLVTAHDAFNYFGRAYGFDVIGIQGISTESEAGLSRVSELVDLLVAREVRAVFVESSVSDRSIRALIEGASARGHKVSIGGELYSDAMGAPGTYEGTYIGMIDHNATIIATSLGGRAPSRGLNGTLSFGT